MPLLGIFKRLVGEEEGSEERPGDTRARQGPSTQVPAPCCVRSEVLLDGTGQLPENCVGKPVWREQARNVKKIN